MYFIKSFVLSLKLLLVVSAITAVIHAPTLFSWVANYKENKEMRRNISETAKLLVNQVPELILSVDF